MREKAILFKLDICVEKTVYVERRKTCIKVSDSPILFNYS